MTYNPLRLIIAVTGRGIWFDPPRYRLVIHANEVLSEFQRTPVRRPCDQANVGGT